MLDELQGEQDVDQKIGMAVVFTLQNNKRRFVDPAEHVLIEDGSPGLIELFPSPWVKPLVAAKQAPAAMANVFAKHRSRLPGVRYGYKLKD